MRGQNCPQETRLLGPLAPVCDSFLICVFVCAKSLQLCPTLGKPMDCSPPGSSVHGKNTGVGCHFFLQGIFPLQELNLCLLRLLH